MSFRTGNASAPPSHSPSSTGPPLPLIITHHQRQRPAQHCHRSTLVPALPFSHSPGTCLKDPNTVRLLCPSFAQTLLTAHSPGGLPARPPSVSFSSVVFITTGSSH